MTDLTLSLVGFAALFFLMAIRVPIGLAMLVVGVIGTASIMGTSGSLGMLKNLPYERFSNYSLSIVPLFLLMGQFASHSGMSRALFTAARSLIGHRRGGLAISAIGSCAAFGAVCGSSLATAGTMAQVALPEMKRAGYKGGLATATLAAGGTLGILIPPSVVLVVYAVIAGQNIQKLFMAALIPGILAALGYVLAIVLFTRLYPDSAPVTERASGQERVRNLLAVWPVLLIFTLVIGGIYTGIFTPTEAAAVGAVGTGLFAYFRGGLGRGGFSASLFGMISGSGMIFFIVLGAAAFNTFLAVTNMPQVAAGWIGGLDVSPWLILATILLAYIVLGCFMDSFSMILLTIPIFYPVIMTLDFGIPPDEVGIWFGILALIVVELGMITPPVGLNIFIINSMAKDVPMVDTMKGVLPFLAIDMIRVVLIVAFPLISMGLVRLLY